MKLRAAAAFVPPPPAALVKGQLNAIAVLTPASKSSIRGIVTITQENSRRWGPGAVTFNVQLWGLTPGAKHAVHVHSWGDITNPASNSTGPHFDPALTKSHMCPGPGVSNAKLHQGDLGNFAADSNGYASATVRMRGNSAYGLQNQRLASLRFQDPGNLIGQAVVVHAMADDCKTQPTGNSGARVAHGVIGWRNGTAFPIPPFHRAKSWLLDPTKNWRNSTQWSAAAVLTPSSNSGVSGTVLFVQRAFDAGVQVVVALNGLKPKAKHAFHVHEFGDISDPAGLAAGLHHNPLGKPHGCPALNGTTTHAGDFGTLEADDQGRIFATLTPSASNILPDSPLSYLGRAVIVHAQPDDCVSQPVGNAGVRIAQGVVGSRDPAANADAAVLAQIGIDATKIPKDWLQAWSGGSGGGVAPVKARGGGSSLLAERPADLPSGPVTLFAQLVPTRGNEKVRGLVSVMFDPATPRQVTVKVVIADLAPNAVHAVHFHNFGDLTDAQGGAQGGHFNPQNLTHACPGVNAAYGSSHVGDIGNVEANMFGEVYKEVTLDMPELVDPNSYLGLVGRGVILHADKDDCKSQPTGNAGARIAQGVLGWTSSSAPWRTKATGKYPPMGQVLAAASGLQAVSVILPTNFSRAFGYARFTQDGPTAPVTIEVGLFEMPRGEQFAVHVHAFGDLSDLDRGGLAAGPHFNPYNVSHACSPNAQRHVGDLGNVESDGLGVVKATFTSELMSLYANVNEGYVVGRSIVVHGKPDDCTSQPAGNAGPRYAAGIIGFRDFLPGVLKVGGDKEALKEVASLALKAYTGKALVDPRPASSSKTRAARVDSLDVAKNAVAQQPELPSGPVTLFAQLVPTRGNEKVRGLVSVHFDPATPRQVKVKVVIADLAPNAIHAVHFHNFGDLTDAQGAAQGGHFNPRNLTHACPGVNAAYGSSHVGDIGNVEANMFGEVYKEVTLDMPELVDPNSYLGLVGRGVILHADKDDCQSQPTGNAGARIAQGVLGWTFTSAPWPAKATGRYPPAGLVLAATAGVEAVAAILPTNFSRAYGYARFTQAGPTTPVTVEVELFDMPKGEKFAVHVHAFGDLSDLDQGGLKAGPHYNPYNVSHACSPSAERHVGDLGNVESDGEGAVKAIFTSELMSLFANVNEGYVIGRSIVVHGKPDDCTSQPAGNAGPRFAIGIIGFRDVLPGALKIATDKAALKEAVRLALKAYTGKTPTDLRRVSSVPSRVVAPVGTVVDFRKLDAPMPRLTGNIRIAAEEEQENSQLVRIMADTAEVDWRGLGMVQHDSSLVFLATYPWPVIRSTMERLLLGCPNLAYGVRDEDVALTVDATRRMAAARWERLRLPLGGPAARQQELRDQVFEHVRNVGSVKWDRVARK
ncbi:hypothetical protein HDU96_010608, partial [Phlyctochytrium bullatum]